MSYLKKTLSLILGAILMTMQLNAFAENDIFPKQYIRNLGKNEGIELIGANEAESRPELKIVNGKIIVNNAVENGTLIVAFYKNDVLTGVRIYKDNGQIEFDLESALNGNLSDATDLKAFFWDRETIRPLCNVLPLPLRTAKPTEKPVSSPTPTPTITPTPAPIPTETPEPKQALTVYFSCTNNTKSLAQKIARVADTDLYEIVPQTPYTSEDLNYNDSSSRANKEMNDANARPAISGGIENLSAYDTIFLGYPIWWGTMPRIINTFLESYDLSGKTIMPFCTSGSSGIGTSVASIKNICAVSDVKEGFRGTSLTTDAQIQSWIDNNITENDTETGLKICIDDKLFTATLENNETVNALRAMLPMSINMSELNGNEKYYYLSESLPTNTESVGTIHAGDIMLYGSSCIVIFYETFNTSYSYTRIGHIDDVTELKSALGSGNVNVTIE